LLYNDYILNLKQSILWMKIGDEVSSPFIETLVLTCHIDIFSNKDLLVTVNLFTNPQNQIGCFTKAKQ